MLKPERKKLLDDLVKSGVHVSDIHKKHGFNHKTIRRHYPDYRKGKGYESRETTKRILAENREQIESLIEERAPGLLIAKISGVSYETFRKYYPEVMWTREEAANYAAMVSQADSIKTRLVG